MRSIIQDEKWSDINGYEESYMISNCGRVWNKKDNKEQIATDNGYGYLIVSLHKQGRKNAYIHRLVAEHFIGSLAGKVVNHIDYNKQNNHFSNLEIVTQKQNIEHSINRMTKPNKNHKPSNTSEKYIYRRGNTFRVCFKKFNIEKSFLPRQMLFFCKSLQHGCFG